jgi:hypothetical protein
VAFGDFRDIIYWIEGIRKADLAAREAHFAGQG